MEKIEKLLGLLSDMENIPQDDKLSKMIAQTEDLASDELDEWELDLVSAAGRQPYLNFLKRIDQAQDV